MKAAEKIFVLHTPRYIDNPMIDGVIINAGVEEEWFPVLEKYGEKVRQVHLTGTNRGELFQKVPPHVGVRKYFAQTKEEVIHWSKLLNEQKWLVCPLFLVEKREDISFITSMGIAVDLLYRIDDLDQAVLLDILHYYLHYSLLEMPIEPFHSILIARLKRQPLLLWHLHLLFPDLFLHVDDTGISGSPAQLEAGEFLYLIDWKTHDITKNNKSNSDHNILKTYFESMPVELPDCMPCLHFHQCFGWAKYDKDTCLKWKAVLDILQRNVRDLEKTRA